MEGADGLADPWQPLVDGDDDAWERAVLQLFGRVRAFFVNKVGEQADELTQRTFRRLLEVRSGYRGGNPRSYVLGIARLVLLEFLRSLKQHDTLPLEELSVAAVDRRPSSVLAAKGEQRLVLEALRQLPLASQIVLELYYWEDMSDREIAEVLDSNPNTIRGRRGTARAQMRALIDRMQADAMPASTSMDIERWARGIRERVFTAPASSRP